MFRKICVSHCIGIDPFVAMILTLAALYVSNGWTPSSYGTVLKSFGADRAGLVIGEPRDIRSDESRVWTPYIQIAVNNAFDRFNKTSVYGEDLRNFNGLPLADWAIAVKPYFWLFFLVPPWYAFSFYHAFFIVIFLIGYYILFQNFGFSKTTSALASVTLFFSSFVQMWWTTWGPVLGGFPWLLVIFTSQCRLVTKTVLIAYTTAAWLLAHFYPPLIITLAFLALLMVAAFQISELNLANLAAAAMGVGVGGAIGIAYLFDAIPAMAATVYPGQRVLSGGGLPSTQWLAQFFPFLVSSGFKNLVNLNICEASTVGSYLLLLIVVFAYGRIQGESPSNNAERANRKLAILLLLAGFALTSVWELLPVPSTLGKLLFWHKVPPRTMLFASGMLLFLVSLCLLQSIKIRLSWPRFILVALIIASVWIISKRWLWHTSLKDSIGEPLILFPLFLVMLFRKGLLPSYRAPALVGCVALANLVGFGGFNPIQEARPIFDRPRTLLIDYLKALEIAHSRKWLVVAPSYGGTVLNGWGFRAIEHTLIAPQLKFFRPFFNGMGDEEFNNAFNRYANILLFDIKEPRVAGVDIIHLPVWEFTPVAPQIILHQGFTRRVLMKGHIDSINSGDPLTKHASILGWAYFDAKKPGAKLHVYSELPIASVKSFPQFRPDLIKTFGDSESIIRGFQIEITLANPVSLDVIRKSLCLVSEDPNEGTFQLNNSAAPSACSNIKKGEV